MELRINQKEPVRLGVEFFKQKKAVPSIIVAPTAFGKSIVIAKIVEGVGEKMLILQPTKELLIQNYKKYMALGKEEATDLFNTQIVNNATIFSASVGQKVIGDVTYATIGSIKSLGALFRERGFTKMIIDECFIAGTLIDGTPIENINIGDFVKSYNHDTGNIEYKKVVRLFKKEAQSDILKLKFTNGAEFICTEEHPIYTTELGYIPAKLLSLNKNLTLFYGGKISDKALYRLHNSNNKKEMSIRKSFLWRRLQESFQITECKENNYELRGVQIGGYFNRWKKNGLLALRKASLLFTGMFSETPIHRNGKTEPEPCVQESIFGPNEVQQSCMDARDSGNNNSKIKRKDFSFTRRQRGIYEASINDALSNRFRNGTSDNYSTGKRHVSEFTTLIQSGPCNRRQENSNRGGRKNTSVEEMEILGSPKNGNFERVRVESCEIYKRRSGEEFEQMREKTTVYNIEVEDNHNYFANGILVHNCHLYPREIDSMLGGFLRDSGMTHVLGLTATPLKLQTNTDLSGNSFSKLVMLTSRSKKGNFFKEIIYASQVKEMVELGFWSKLEYEQYDIDDSKLVYNSTKAEFTEESIKAVYLANNTGAKIKEKLTELSDRKSILVFVPSVEEARRLAGENAGSVAVYGDMDGKERDAAVNGFKAGRIRVIFNVNVLSVGFDHPGVDAILCARTTASLAWYYQALGRGTRIEDGKKDCLIVDFSGNVKKFGKLENFEFVKEGQTWKLYGEGGKLLSGMPLHEIGSATKETEAAKTAEENGPPRWRFGKFKGKLVSETDPGYAKWALENIDFSKMKKVKEVLQELLKVPA